MKAILAVDIRYKDRVPWAGADAPVFLKGSVVDVVPASNLPSDSNIKFWIHEPELQGDPYGMALYIGEYEIVDDGVSMGEIPADIAAAIYWLARNYHSPDLSARYENCKSCLLTEIERLRKVADTCNRLADKIERCIQGL